MLCDMHTLRRLQARLHKGTATKQVEPLCHKTRVHHLHWCALTEVGIFTMLPLINDGECFEWHFEIWLCYCSQHVTNVLKNQIQNKTIQKQGLHLKYIKCVFDMTCNHILMKHLISLYELFKTSQQSQVCQSCQPRIWHKGAGPEPGGSKAKPGWCLVTRLFWFRRMFRVELFSVKVCVANETKASKILKTKKKNLNCAQLCQQCRDGNMWRRIRLGQKKDRGKERRQMWKKTNVWNGHYYFI